MTVSITGKDIFARDEPAEVKPEARTWEHNPEPADEPESSEYESCEEAESAGHQRVQGSQGGG